MWSRAEQSRAEQRSAQVSWKRAPRSHNVHKKEKLSGDATSLMSVNSCSCTSLWASIYSSGGSVALYGFMKYRRKVLVEWMISSELHRSASQWRIPSSRYKAPGIRQAVDREERHWAKFQMTPKECCTVGCTVICGCWLGLYRARVGGEVSTWCNRWLVSLPIFGPCSVEGCA